MKAILFAVLLSSMCSFVALSQQSALPSFQGSALSYFKDYVDRAKKASSLLQRKSMDAIDRMQRAEERLIRKLSRKDSTKAAKMAGTIQQRYQQYRSLLTDSVRIDPLRQQYLPGLDSATIVLKLIGLTGLTGKDKILLGSMQEELQRLQLGLTRNNVLAQTLSSRLGDLRGDLGEIGFLKEFKKITQTVAYYKSSLAQLKGWVNEPDRALAKLVTVLSETKLFQGLFSRYSVLSAILPPPASLPIDPLAAGSMQVRNAVMTSLGQGTGITNAARYLRQASPGVNNPLQEVTDRLRSLRQDKNLQDPTEHVPNEQRSRPFLKRLELGSNFQTTRSSNYFPTASDVGMSLAFRINDKSVIGLGAAYKLGWGKDIRHIRLSHEGVSFRSFVNAKIKGAFHATGGWEYHYQQPFADFRALPDISTWRQSALLGITKKMMMRSKVLRSTQVQLLVDFLAFNTTNPPVVFRVGYQFTK